MRAEIRPAKLMYGQRLFQGQLTEDWLTVFDLKYINEKMLGGLRRASGKIEDYCDKLAVKAFSLSQVGVSVHIPRNLRVWTALFSAK